LEAQGASYQLVQIVPDADGSTLRITGHGIDTDPPGSTGGRNVYSGTQQTDSGPYQAKVGTTVKYVVDTTPGNSGSPVEHVADGLVYAIHTYGGCADPGGANQGTAVDHPGLQGALGCPIGVCAEDCNSNGIYDGCDIDCLFPCGDCNVPGCGASNDCNSNSVPDECDGPLPACCLPSGGCIETLKSCCADVGGLVRAQYTCATLPFGCQPWLGPGDP
jgi:hypothetical protein